MKTIMKMFLFTIWEMHKVAFNIVKLFILLIHLFDIA